MDEIDLVIDENFGIRIQEEKIKKLQRNIRYIRECICEVKNQKKFADMLGIGRSTYTKIEKGYQYYPINRIIATALMGVLDYEKNIIINWLEISKGDKKIKYENKIKKLVEIISPELWKNLNILVDKRLTSNQISAIRAYSFSAQWIEYIKASDVYINGDNFNERIIYNIKDAVILIEPFGFNNYNLFKNMIDDFVEPMVKCNKKFYIDEYSYKIYMDSRLEYYRDIKTNGKAYDAYLISKEILKLQYHDMLEIKSMVSIYETIDTADNANYNYYKNKVIKIASNPRELIEYAVNYDPRYFSFIRAAFDERETVNQNKYDIELEDFIDEEKRQNVWLYEGKRKIRTKFLFGELQKINGYEDILKRMCIITIYRVLELIDEDENDIDFRKTCINNINKAFLKVFNEELDSWSNYYCECGTDEIIIDSINLYRSFMDYFCEG